MSLNSKSLLLLAVVLLAGVLGGTVVYRSVTPASGAEPSPRKTLVVDSADAGAAQQATRDKRRPEFAPCREPARLEGGSCVTDEVRTVTVPAQGPGSAAAPSAPAAPAAPSSSGSSTQHHSGDDDHAHHGGDDDHGHHGGHDDDGDDDDDHGGHGGDDHGGHGGHGGDDDHDDDHDDD